jgi:hypothetical protein
VFLRLYLLGRSILLHSGLIRNITLRTFVYLNHVSLDAFFLIKSYLELWPIRCLLTCCITIFFVGSWSLRACDYEPTREHRSMSDSMWLFIVTFTTTGMCVTFDRNINCDYLCRLRRFIPNDILCKK